MTTKEIIHDIPARKRVGEDGVITVEDASGMDTIVEYVETKTPLLNTESAYDRENVDHGSRGAADRRPRPRAPPSDGPRSSAP